MSKGTKDSSGNVFYITLGKKHNFDDNTQIYGQVIYNYPLLEQFNYLVGNEGLEKPILTSETVLIEDSGCWDDFVPKEEDDE